MKEIKVFLASSEELTNERKEIADLVLNLNEIYSEKDITIRLIKWEYLGKTYNGVRKQEEYNQAVRLCDIFLGLFYTKAGGFTVEEFDIAIDQYNKSRQTPMILVFLKDLMPTDIEDDSLKLFKSRLAADLGHYWARFNHTDKLKLDIVLQLQRFDIFGQSGQVYVKDSNIYLADGTMVASLENLSFAANNQQWNQLKNEVAKLERKIKRYSTIKDLDEDELSDFAEMKTELDEKQKSLQNLEHSMFDTALIIAQSVGTKSSERLRKAQEYFELGDISSANIVLDYQEVMTDADNNKHMYEQEQKILEVRRENLLLNIQELRMKISLLVSKKQDDFTEEDCSNALGAFDKITELCQIIKMDDSEQWNIGIELLNQFYRSNKFSSEFIILLSWGFIHGLKKDSLSMGYEAAYRFIIKCLLIIAKSYKADTHKYSDTLLRLLSLALEYNKKVYKEDNIERANIYALIGDTYYHRFSETSFRFDEQILSNCFKSKEIREKLLGKNHPDTINIISNIAYYLHRIFYGEQAVEIMGSLMDRISSTYNEYRPEEGTYIVDTRFNIESVYYVFNTALYYGNYADLLRENKQFKDAIIWYEKSLDIEKTDYDSLCGYMARMGRCYVELENYERGIECMKQSLKMATANSDVEPMTDDEKDFYWYWGYCAYSEGMSFPLVYMISFAYYKDGNYDESIKYAIMYLELNLRAQKWNDSNPDSLLETYDIAEAYCHLGLVYYEAGQYEKSIVALENALNVLQGRKDYMTEAPAVLELLVNSCNSFGEAEKAGMYANELNRINTTIEEDPLLYEPSISTLVLLEKKELPNVILEAGDYTILKYGEFEVGKNVPFDKTMQDEELKDLVILQNKRICKYHTSLKHCGFIINTSAVDADSVNTLIEGLNKFNVNEMDNGPLYNPFINSIEIKEPLNTACGNVIPSGVYPLFKYGTFEVGKFQQFDKYVQEYDLPQITIIQIGNELYGFGVRLKDHNFSWIKTNKNSNVVKEHVERLQKFLDEKYVPDEASIFLTIGPTIKFELPIQIGDVTISNEETYNLIQMGDYIIGNLNEPDLSNSESFVILTNDYGFLQIDSKAIEGVMDYTITTYQVEKDLVERIREAYEEWKQQRGII